MGGLTGLAWAGLVRAPGAEDAVGTSRGVRAQRYRSAPAHRGHVVHPVASRPAVPGGGVRRVVTWVGAAREARGDRWPVWVAPFSWLVGWAVFTG
jgi:hypothetical protein